MAKSSESANKLTQREYAAIHLAVPSSGTEWLDEMIRKANGQHEPVQGSVTEPPQGPKNPPKGGAGKKVA